MKRIFLILALLPLSAVVVFPTNWAMAAMSERQQQIYNDGIGYFVECSGRATGDCPRLAEIRQRMVQGLSSENKLKIYKAVLAEGSTSEARVMAHMEALLNRAAARWTRPNLQENLIAEILISPFYYAALHMDFSNGFGLDINRYMDTFDSAWEKVISGSNITHAATDNASLGVIENQPRSLVICGMKGEDKECKTNAYGLDNWPAGVEAGVEYFAKNNGRVWSDQMALECRTAQSNSSGNCGTGSNALGDFMNDGSWIYYNQISKAYNQNANDYTEPPGHREGCMTYAVTMAMANLLGDKGITPESIYNEQNPKWFAYSIYNAMNFINLGRHQVSAVMIDRNQIDTYLSRGAIIVHGVSGISQANSNGHVIRDWDGFGHYFVIRGKDGNGMYKVADSASPHLLSDYWPESIIKNIPGSTGFIMAVTRR